MRRHKWKLLAVLAVLGAASVWLFWPSPTLRFSPENYARITADMTRADVEALLGPPGDFRIKPDAYAWNAPRAQELIAGAGSNKVILDGGKEEWYGDEGYIAVCFDPSGRAAYKAHMPGRGSLASLRWWLLRH